MSLLPLGEEDKFSLDVHIGSDRLLLGFPVLAGGAERRGRGDGGGGAAGAPAIKSTVKRCLLDASTSSSLDGTTGRMRLLLASSSLAMDLRSW